MYRPVKCQDIFIPFIGAFTSDDCTAHITDVHSHLITHILPCQRSWGGILLYAFIPQIVSFFSLETSRENLYQWPRDNDKPFSVQKLNGTIN